MMDQMLETFAIRPEVNLELMQPDQSLAHFAARSLEMLDMYFKKVNPHFLLIQGDTSSAMTAALAAFYQHIPLGHVEAGLRTGNKNSPYPEEINRVIISRLADLHFAPTAKARENLIQEGVAEHQIHVTGNPVIDTLSLVIDKVRKSRPEVPGLPPELIESLERRPLVLITSHRRENFGVPFKEICRAITMLAERFSGNWFVYPVHFNPNVREPVRRMLQSLKNVCVIEPLSYVPFVWLMDRASLILTDSGGIQEEAPYLGKAVLVMRDTTERPEGLCAGVSMLVGSNAERIVSEASRLLMNESARAAMMCAVNPYGDGHAAERIIFAIETFLRECHTENNSLEKFF